jgi:hypothetical protein
LLLSIRAIAGRQFRTRGNSTAALKPLSVLIGIALWLALFESGFDPVVSGLRGTALSAGTGFTVSLLDQATVGILATALPAPAR